VLLPLYWLALFGFLIGMAYVLGALAVFVPDVRDVLQVVLALGLFLSPILYLPGQVPAWLAYVFPVNPFSYVIWPHKDLVFHGAVTALAPWLVLVALDAVLLVGGMKLFRALQGRFGDVL
jgi:homopolymeric O-antigen transport system permease protein